MSQPSVPDTSPSLLGRLRRGDDPAAWDEFVRRYAAVIYDWCRRWRLQDADAQDVTQAVLVKLVRRLRTFEYDPAQSFRSWLWTVARHTWADFVADRSAERSAGAGPLADLASRDDLLARLDAEYDRELFDRAAGRVRLRVSPHTWEAFRRVVVDREAPARVAADLGLPVASVYKARTNVFKMLREEVGRLDRPDPPEGD